MIVKVSGQFRSTKMSRGLNVYREFWCNSEGFACKYFIRKLHTDSYKLYPRQCRPKQGSGKYLENKTRNDIRSTLSYNTLLSLSTYSYVTSYKL